MTTKKSKPKLSYSILCDDIREEAGNKLSFMGVYGSAGIFIPQTPFTFPMLCVVMSFKNIKGGDSFVSELYSPSGKKIGGKISGTIPAKEKAKGDLSIFGKYAPLKVDEEGVFKVVVIFNDDKSTKHEVSIPIKVRK